MNQPMEVGRFTARLEVPNLCLLACGERTGVSVTVLPQDVKSGPELLSADAITVCPARAPECYICIFSEHADIYLTS
jgi:hypothetical protein